MLLLDGFYHLPRDSPHVWRAKGLRVRLSGGEYFVQSATTPGRWYRVLVHRKGDGYWANCMCSAAKLCKHMFAAAIADETFYRKGTGIKAA
jgi:hypothetical protein